MVQGRPEGGWTGESQIVCCDCGDDPDRDYREVSPALQIRGSYPIAVGITAHVRHTLVSGLRLFRDAGADRSQRGDERAGDR